MPTVADILSEEQLLQAYELMDSLIKADDEKNADAIVALKAFIQRKFYELTAEEMQHLEA